MVLVDYKNIILPAYTTMQEIMSSAIMGEEKRLEKIIQKNLPIDIQYSLVTCPWISKPI